MATYDSSALYDTSVLYDQVSSAQPNMTTNRVSAVLAAAALTNINTAVATIRTNLPFLVALTPQERRDLVKAGDKSQAAVNLGLIFATQHPEALPANFDSAEFAKDGALSTSLTSVALLIAQLNEDVQDTLLALHSDLMLEFLDLYAFAKANNRDGRYDSFIQSISGRFAKTRKTTPVTPPPTP